MSDQGEIKDEYYIFVIDCTEYSGNYERQMTAYITNRYADCEVGKEIADDISSELEEFQDEIDDLICFRTDEHGRYRPCEIIPTPGWINNGMGVHTRIPSDEQSPKGYPAYNSVGIFLYEIPSDKILNLFMERAKNYSNYITQKKKENPEKYKFESSNGEVEGFRLIKVETINKTLKVWK